MRTPPPPTGSPQPHIYVPSAADTHGLVTGETRKKACGCLCALRCDLTPSEKPLDFSFTGLTFDKLHFFLFVYFGRIFFLFPKTLIIYENCLYL